MTTSPNRSRETHGGRAMAALALLLALDALAVPSLARAAPGVVASAPAFSGVIGDPTDHSATVGIPVTIVDPAFALAELEVTATSTNPAVVPHTGLAIEPLDATRIALRVAPSGVGYATLTITARNPLGETGSATVAFAASQPILPVGATTWPIGGADASALETLGPNHVLAAIDEDQVLRIWPIDRSGPPVRAFDLTPFLGLTDFGGGGQPREVDFEAMTRRGARIIVIGSHGNAASGALRPNRRRIAAVEIGGTAPDWTLSHVGRYDGLREDLLAWDAANGHGLGANALGLAASAAAGVPPEAPGGGGFNLEGLAIAPDGATALLGFRAPLQPPGERRLALIVPLANLDALIAGNPAPGPAQFGAPIRLDLGGLGVRSIECAADGCLIVAGSADGEGPFRLFRWSGLASDAPVRLDSNLSGQRPEGLALAAPSTAVGVPIVLASDLGDTVFYGDGIAAKDLPEPLWRKFRLDRLAAGAALGDAVFASGFEP